MKNISKYLLDGQLNILFGSYRDIFCRQPVGGMFIQEAILPSSKRRKMYTEMKGRGGGREGTEYELCSGNKLMRRFYETQNRNPLSLIPHFIRSGCLQILQCLSMKLAE